MDAAAGVSLLELQDVADIGPAPGVDGLVVVPHDEQRARSIMEEPDQGLLAWIDVLVLVHHQVTQLTDGPLRPGSLFRKASTTLRIIKEKSMY